MTTRGTWIGPTYASRALSVVVGAIALGLLILGFGLFPNRVNLSGEYVVGFAGWTAIATCVASRKSGILRALGRGFVTGAVVAASLASIGAAYDSLSPMVERYPGLVDLWGFLVAGSVVLSGFAAVLWERTAKRRSEVGVDLLLSWLILGGFVLVLVGRSSAPLGVFLAGVAGVSAFLRGLRHRPAREVTS